MNEITVAVTHPWKQKPQSTVASRPYLPQLGDKDLKVLSFPWANGPGCGSGLGKGLDLGTRVESSHRAESRQASPVDTRPVCLLHLNFRYNSIYHKFMAHSSSHSFT